MPFLKRFFDNTVNFPNITAIQYDGHVYTYGELGQLIKKMGLRLYSSTQAKKERVLILLPNSPEFIISFFSITSLGKVAVLADINFVEELLNIVKDNDISKIITKSHMKEKVQQILCNGGIASEKIQFIIADNLICELNLRDDSEANIKVDIDSNDLAMILYTSGSSNRPKGVRNSYTNIEEAAKNYLETLNICKEDKLVAVIPFFHSYAFGSCMMAGLFAGATLLIEDGFVPSKVLNLIEREKATIFQGVPYMYKHINQRLSKGDYNIKSLRFCISAGAVLNEEIARDFYSITKKVIHQEYGSTETGTIALNMSDDLEKNIHSVGQPLKNIEINICIENEEESGIIEVKSKAISLGYIDEDFMSGCWYKTGDIGYLDDDNYIFIVGREKRMINIAGKKVNPSEIEAILLKSSDVSEVLVRGIILDSEEAIEALIVTKNKSLNKDDVKKFCIGKIAPYKIPRVINWVDSLPKSSLGKNKFGK